MIKNLSKTKPTIDPNGPLRMIAVLIYECRTGKPIDDLERACKAALKAAKAGRD